MTRDEAQQRARDLVAVLGGSVPDEAFEAITDAFMSCVRAEWERLSTLSAENVDNVMEQVQKAGTVSGTTIDRVPPLVTIPYGRLRTIINGAIVTKAARDEVDAKYPERVAEFAAKYPEHARFEGERLKWNAVYAFLVWLQSQKLTICESNPALGEYFPIVKTLGMILNEHFEIDEKRMDEERQAMLKAFQQQTQQVEETKP